MRPAPSPFPPPAAPPRPRRFRVRTRSRSGFPLLLLLLFGWILLGYLAFRSSVEAANAPPGRIQAARQPGLAPAVGAAAQPLDQHPRARRRRTPGQPAALGHAADHPHRSRQAPRLDAEHPARPAVESRAAAETKLNAAYTLGGPALTVKPCRADRPADQPHRSSSTSAASVDWSTRSAASTSSRRGRCARLRGPHRQFPKGVQHLDGAARAGLRPRAQERARPDRLRRLPRPARPAGDRRHPRRARLAGLAVPAAQARRVGGRSARHRPAANEILPLGWVSWRAAARAAVQPRRRSVHRRTARPSAGRTAATPRACSASSSARRRAAGAGTVRDRLSRGGLPVRSRCGDGAPQRQGERSGRRRRPRHAMLDGHRARRQQRLRLRTGRGRPPSPR